MLKTIISKSRNAFILVIDPRIYQYTKISPNSEANVLKINYK